MGAVRTIALVILGISGLTFIALFGRLPSFRKTPVSFLYKAIWVYIPKGIAYIDSCLLGGRISYCWGWSGRYILHENHPLVLILFLSLLLAGELLFIPSAWPRISSVHKPFIPVVALLPYIFLYASVVTKSFITRKNHAEELDRYPHDGIIFHSGQRCRTCHLLKPARSKHCSFCNACVSRHDHHCVWLMNCVGRDNYVYFLSLLLSLSVMLTYGSYLGYGVLCQTRDLLLPSGSHLRLIQQDWTTFFNIWFVVLAADARVGVVFMLAFMTAPLAMAFLVYHTYLIWAGMTINESGKWSELKDDVADGYVFKSTKREIYGTTSTGSSSCSWPGNSEQILILTDGDPPTEGDLELLLSNNNVQDGHAEGPVDRRWTRVRSMKEVDNIYDLGFWDNLRDAVKLRVK